MYTSLLHGAPRTTRRSKESKAGDRDLELCADAVDRERRESQDVDADNSPSSNNPAPHPRSAATGSHRMGPRAGYPPTRSGILAAFDSNPSRLLPMSSEYPPLNCRVRQRLDHTSLAFFLSAARIASYGTLSRSRKVLCTVNRTRTVYRKVPP